jgi:glycine/D-amino acid oxidase-like deaminating enzyme
MSDAEKPDRATTATVIGGGIIGLACALGLQHRGIATVLVDPAMLPRSASWGNAGHIATEQVAPLASPRMLASLPGRLFSRGGAAAFPPRDIGAWLPFGCRLLRASRPGRFIAGTAALKSLLTGALPAWRRLTAATGSGELLAEDGHFVLWETAEGARAGRENWSCGDPGSVTVHDLTREETARLGALLSRIPVDGLRFSGTARVRDPGKLLDALGHAFALRGGEWRREQVECLETVRGRARARLQGGRLLDTDLVVVAAGLDSARILRRLGHRAPVIAERGYHIQSAHTDWPDMPPLVFEERSMIVSRIHSGLRAAGFVEFARAASPPDPRKWLRLRTHAAELRLSMKSPVHEWMGARPTLPDYLPAIGRSRHARNLLYAFGHQHLGLTLAAITGELVAELAAGTEPAAPLAPFSLDRFD